MKICVIAPKKSRETVLIKAECEERGYDFKKVLLADIYLEVKDSKFYASHRKIELLDYDAFIFRSISKDLWHAKILAEYLRLNGKLVIDECVATERWMPPLVFHTLAEHKIPQLNNVYTIGLKAARDVLMEIEHPISIRYTNDKDHQKLVYSEDWTDSYDLVRTNKNKKFQFQEDLDLPFYYRIYVIGDEVIGGLKKTIKENRYQLNSAKKVVSAQIEVSEELSTLALKASNAVKVNIGAVDIVEYKGELYVIGVQRSPTFTKFQKITGINFTSKVLDYIEEKLNRNI